jgi:hypothetical protein
MADEPFRHLPDDQHRRPISREGRDLPRRMGDHGHRDDVDVT